MKIERYMEVKKCAFNKDLLRYYAKFKKSNVLNKAIWYSLSNGGKRIRPILLQEISKGIGLRKAQYLNAMISIELIHCYSLVHDDLPSMDDDDYRRGKPSTHKKFNEAQAILSGNSLLTLSFELLAEKYPSKLCKELSYVAGINGLAGGQSKDMEIKSKSITLKKILELHEMKTAKLFEFCCAAPFIISGKDKKTINVARNYGKLIGKIFQIIDDILDFEEDDDCNNILNHYDRAEALSLCSKYKEDADRSFKKILQTRDNRAKDILEFIIKQAN
jgi:geranylgeranyl pyrophosphate synthase